VSALNDEIEAYRSARIVYLELAREVTNGGADFARLNGELGNGQDELATLIERTLAPTFWNAPVEEMERYFATVLSTRKRLASVVLDIERVHKELELATARKTARKHELVERARKIQQLLHADLSGLLGKPAPDIDTSVQEHLEEVQEASAP